MEKGAQWVGKTPIVERPQALRDTNPSFPLSAHLGHLTVSLYTQFSHLRNEVGTVYSQESLEDSLGYYLKSIPFGTWNIL